MIGDTEKVEALNALVEPTLLGVPLLLFAANDVSDDSRTNELHSRDLECWLGSQEPFGCVFETMDEPVSPRNSNICDPLK